MLLGKVNFLLINPTPSTLARVCQVTILHRVLNAFLNAELQRRQYDSDSSDLPWGVYEDRATEQSAAEQSSVSIHIPDPFVVKETFSEVLREQRQTSPLWTCYAAHEMANGNIKVFLPQPVHIRVVNGKLSATLSELDIHRSCLLV